MLDIARFRIKIAKNLAGSEQPVFVCGQRCAGVGGFGAMLLLCGFATGCDKTHWHGCVQERFSYVATLLAGGIAAGGC